MDDLEFPTTLSIIVGLVGAAAASLGPLTQGDVFLAAFTGVFAGGCMFLGTWVLSASVALVWGVTRRGVNHLRAGRRREALAERGAPLATLILTDEERVRWARATWSQRWLLASVVLVGVMAIPSVLLPISVASAITLGGDLWGPWQAMLLSWMAMALGILGVASHEDTDGELGQILSAHLGHVSFDDRTMRLRLDHATVTLRGGQQLSLRAKIKGLPRVSAVARETLELAMKDVVTGDDAFDRATLVDLHGRRDIAGVELPADLRTALAPLMAKGASLDHEALHWHRSVRSVADVETLMAELQSVDQLVARAAAYRSLPWQRRLVHALRVARSARERLHIWDALRSDLDAPVVHALQHLATDAGAASMVRAEATWRVLEHRPEFIDTVAVQPDFIPLLPVLLEAHRPKVRFTMPEGLDPAAAVGVAAMAVTFDATTRLPELPRWLDGLADDVALLPALQALAAVRPDKGEHDAALREAIARLEGVAERAKERQVGAVSLVEGAIGGVTEAGDDSARGGLTDG